MKVALHQLWSPYSVSPISFALSSRSLVRHWRLVASDPDMPDLGTWMHHTRGTIRLGSVPQDPSPAIQILWDGLQMEQRGIFWGQVIPRRRFLASQNSMDSLGPSEALTTFSSQRWHRELMKVQISHAAQTPSPSQRLFKSRSPHIDALRFSSSASSSLT